MFVVFLSRVLKQQPAGKEVSRIQKSEKKALFKEKEREAFYSRDPASEEKRRKAFHWVHSKQL